MSYFFTFLILFPVWVIWSGMLDVFHLALGVISCAIVTLLSHDLLFKRRTFSAWAGETRRFIQYLPWLLYQVVIANFHVVYLVLHPKMPIEPRLVRCKSGLKSELALVAFANSITLTPGTITADIIDGEYVVHAISKQTADDLMTGDMEKRVARIFEDR
jgi:multicomponent Na+:H+ antiporter subunit E